MLKIENLKLCYGKNLILNDINLEIADHSYNVLLGSNGSGKTSLVRCILGLIENYTGNIYFNSKKLSSDIISQNFGYVPQSSNINFDFPIKVKELIELECGTKNMCEIHHSELFEQLKITKLFDKQLSDLSGGQLQKVLIARGLVIGPKVLVLDEPTNNLDSESKKYVLDFLNKLQENLKILVIHITHNENLFSNGGYKIFKMIDGTLEI